MIEALIGKYLDFMKIKGLIETDRNLNILKFLVNIRQYILQLELVELCWHISSFALLFLVCVPGLDLFQH